MKKYINYIRSGCLLGIGLLFYSCSDDFLEVVPKDQVAAPVIFSTETTGDLALYDAYKMLPDQEGHGNEEAYYSYDHFENWSDNTVCCFSWAVSFRDTQERPMGADVYNPGWYNHGYPAMPFLYISGYANSGSIFMGIRKANFFMKNATEYKANFSETWYKTRMAEARFIRAYLYHMGWMAYGGLPIITEPLSLIEQGDEIFRPRATIEETGKFIIEELRLAAEDLPDEVSKGRATRVAALTLKAWCELYMKNYTDAVTTCEEIMTKSVAGHNLFQGGYNAQFMAENNNNIECIFAYQHDVKSLPGLRSKYYGPKGEYGGWAGMQPSQSLVNAYRMSDGLPQDKSPLYDPQRPYDNREKRFYESVIYDGAEFAGKVYSMDKGDLYNPAQEYQTGYFRRKGINPAMTTADMQNNADGANYPFFRYPEVLLMYAEAKIELNQIDQSVYDAIDKVRTRGELPTLKESYKKESFGQTELREILRNERRIELAFEGGKRYWDLIRWRTAHIILNQSYFGMTKNTAGEYEEVLIKKCTFHEDRNYLFPLYTPWLEQNPEMRAQNGGPDGWVNGQNPGY